VSPPSVDDFAVDYVAVDGTRDRVELADAWVVRFEAVAPARGLCPQGSAASAGSLVVGNRWRSCGLRVVAGTRSCDGAGFDLSVVGIASQPFWLSWTTAEGRVRSHAPDYCQAAQGHVAVRANSRSAVRETSMTDAAHLAEIWASFRLAGKWRRPVRRR
jgi:hypothetical protein